MMFKHIYQIILSPEQSSKLFKSPKSKKIICYTYKEAVTTCKLYKISTRNIKKYVPPSKKY